MNNINPLNAELNPICYLLSLLGVHHIFHVSRLRVKIISVSHQYCLSLFAAVPALLWPLSGFGLYDKQAEIYWSQKITSL